MPTSRRTVLAALGLLPLVVSRAHAMAPARRFITCARTAEGRYAAVMFDESGGIVSLLPLPQRGHDAAISPNGRHAVVFGRRPADFMIAFAIDAPEDAVRLTAAEGRHFYGHGCFSADGTHLFATENAYDEARGIIGVYDVTDNFKRLGEFFSGGVGPHEVMMLRDGRTMAIANGGIETHPDYPRQKLNIPSMAPNLSYMNAGTGTLQEMVEPPAEMHQLSLRHMTQAADGTVWIGGQYEGPAEHRVPLIGVHRRGQDLEFITDEAPTAALRQYVGSVASSADGGLVGITSPRGGVLQIWRTIDRCIASQQALADVCGLSDSPSGFIASDGAGRVWQDDTLLAENAGWSWDNHIAAVPAPNIS